MPSIKSFPLFFLVTILVFLLPLLTSAFPKGDIYRTSTPELVARYANVRLGPSSSSVVNGIVLDLSTSTFLGAPPVGPSARRRKVTRKRASCPIAVSSSSLSLNATATATNTLSSPLPVFSLAVNGTGTASQSGSASSAIASRSAGASASASASASSILESDNGILTITTTHFNTVYTTMISSAPSAPSSTIALTNIVVAPTTTASAASAATTTASTSSVTVDPAGAGPFEGDGTWFYTGLGACGNLNVASDYIVAVSYLLFDSWPGATSNPNDNPICNQYLNITLPGTGSIVAQVEDRCTTCGERDLDMTTGLFEALVGQGEEGLDLGRIGVEWTWV